RVSCTVVSAFFRVVFAFDGSGAFQLPAACFADGEMFVEAWVGAVDHTGKVCPTDVAYGQYSGIDRIHLDGNSVVKHVAFAFKIFASGFHSVFDDPSMKLIDILESLLQQECGSFFAFDATRAVG